MVKVNKIFKRSKSRKKSRRRRSSKSRKVSRKKSRRKSMMLFGDKPAYGCLKNNK